MDHHLEGDASAPPPAPVDTIINEIEALTLHNVENLEKESEDSNLQLLKIAEIREREAVANMMGKFNKFNLYMKPVQWLQISAHFAHSQLRGTFCCPKDDTELFFYQPAELEYTSWGGKVNICRLNANTGEFKVLFQTATPVCMQVREDKILFGAHTGHFWYIHRDTQQSFYLHSEHEIDHDMNNSFCSYWIPPASYFANGGAFEPHECRERIALMRNSAHRSMEVYDPVTLEKYFTQPLPSTDRSTLMSWMAQSPDRKRVAAVGDLSELYIFDIVDAQGRLRLRKTVRLTDDSHMCDWSPCGKFVCTSERYGTIFDSTTLELLYTVQGIHDSFFECCRFAPMTERTVAVFAERKKFIHVVDCSNFQRHQIINIFPPESPMMTYYPDTSGICFSPSSNTLYVGVQKISPYHNVGVAKNNDPATRGFIVKIVFVGPLTLRDACAQVIQKAPEKFPAVAELQKVLPPELIELIKSSSNY